jgi:small subunit ribosomal protein S11
MLGELWAVVGVKDQKKLKFMGKKRVIKETTEEILKEKEAREATVKKKKEVKVKQLDRANIYIQSTYNNTIVTITDLQGDVVAGESAGAIGFKGPKKATPFAATKVVDSLVAKLGKLTLKEINVFIKGVGAGREAAIRALAANGLDIVSIKDITPIPHNGCRPRKPRRV